MSDWAKTDRHATSVYPFRRRKRWWRKFASPRWLLIAAPALLLPLLAVALFEDDEQPTPIEQALSALPLPGDAVLPKGGKRFSLLGNTTRGVTPSATLQIYNNSARAEAERIDQRATVGAGDQDIVDFDSATYAALHPRSLAGEDLMVGDLALLTQSFTPDLSYIYFLEFCNATPDDRTYTTKLSDLPLSSGILNALSTLQPGSGLSSYCKRVG